MKKILACAALLGAATQSFAVAPGGPNCGWGNMLFQGQSGMLPHFAASITNGTSGNATFGMTSGTNGCSVNGTLTYGGKAMVSAVMDELSVDVARGEGEALTAVAVAFGIAPEDRSAFAKLTQDNFASIFPSAEVTADHVIHTLETLVRQDPQLAKYAA